MALPKLPHSMEVGRGTALLLEGHVPDADSTLALEVELEGRRIPVLAFGMPPPGSLSGAGWWQAIVPIPPVDASGEHTLRLWRRSRRGAWEQEPLGVITLETGAFADGPVAAEGRTGRVAICLATHDPPLDLLERQLESIRAQTYDDWICIVSDDDSPEAKWSEIQRLIGADERFRLERAPARSGFYRNFERALRLVPPDAAYVALADQDDAWHPEKLEVLVDALAGGGVLVHSDARVVDVRGRLLAPSLWSNGPPRDDDLSSLLFASAVTGASCLFRRRLLPWALPFPPLAGQPFHDRWLALVASAVGEIVRVDRPLYDYVQHDRAVLGHAGVAGDLRRSSAAAALRKARKAARGELRPDWRAHHDGTLMRTAMEAEVLRLRVGHALSRRERRKLAAAAALPRSLLAQAGLLARYVAGKGRHPGLGGALLRGLAWRRIARFRTFGVATKRRVAEASARSRERAELSSKQAIRELEAKGVPLPSALNRLAHVPASAAAEAQLRRTLSSVAKNRSGPSVSVVVLGEGEPPKALEATDYEPWELVSASDGLSEAVGRCDSELVLLLDPRTEPIGSAWLAAMVEALRSHGAACVGARLVHPRRPESWRVRHPDLTLAQRGLHFPPGEGRMPIAARLGAGEPPLSPAARTTVEVPAVSAACMLVRKAALEELDLPGFPKSLDALGAEISVGLRERGGRVLYAADAVALHPGDDDQAPGELHDCAGPLLFRRTFEDRLQGGRAWTTSPLRVGITVTRASARFGHGDHQVASELGLELQELGWEVVLVEHYRDRWRRVVSELDVLLVLLDRFPLEGVPRGVVSVAWIRNWTERWLERPWFDDFDLVLTSSARSKQLVEERSSKVAEVMPLAVNSHHFKPVATDSKLAADVLFAGNRWGAERQVEGALEALPESFSVRVLGRGWEESPRLRARTSGRAGYARMPAAYSAARVVVDDSAAHARPYGAVNARVFEALACGSLVVTNDAEGVRELFDDEFPVWSDGPSLRQQVEAAQAEPERSRELVERYRRVVLERHTYRHRAEQLRDALLRWNECSRVGIAVGVPDRAEAESWGDYHFARGLARSFERRGWPARVHLLDEWQTPHPARDDVCLHLFGLSTMTPRPAQLSAIWNISHPELVTPELLGAYDLAFVASESFAAELAEAGRGRAEVLLQATDPARFRPSPGRDRFELLFVGNARGRTRPVVRAAARSGHRLSVFGGGWTQELIDPVHVAGSEVRNADLHRLYSTAAVVLSDHWPEMRERGFISNRIYDALASGACVVSDHVEGMHEKFDGAVVTFAEERELHALLDRVLSDPAERADRAERGRRAVLRRHTFDHRVDRLLELFEPMLEKRSAQPVQDPAPGTFQARA